ncbi:MAG TPA: hypothetical protein VHI93_00820, partial [Candidatus Thermoplasmatota archaeon]|nr:hypothetical protein [Candidatus Thermoplasmatota archaeon]
LDLLAGGPAPRRRRSGAEVLRRLGEVRGSLVECIRLNGANDEEAAALLAYVEAVLAAGPDRRRLARMLHPLA